MLELWVDGKKVNAEDIKIVSIGKQDEKIEVRAQMQDDDTVWVSLRQWDSLGRLRAELESWGDNGRVKSNITLSNPPKE